MAVRFKVMSTQLEGNKGLHGALDLRREGFLVELGLNPKPCPEEEDPGFDQDFSAR